MLGLGLSALFVRETRGHVALEITQTTSRLRPTGPAVSFRRVFAVTTWRDRKLAAAYQAPAHQEPERRHVLGDLSALLRELRASASRRSESSRPRTQGSGARSRLSSGLFSDWIGRKGLIAGGMFVQAGGIWVAVLAPILSGCWAPCSRGSGRPWSIPRCSRSSKMSRTPPCRPRATACTDAGVTSATPWARSSRDSWPTGWAWPPPFTWWPRSPCYRGLLSSSGCRRPWASGDASPSSTIQPTYSLNDLTTEPSQSARSR